MLCIYCIAASPQLDNSRTCLVARRCTPGVLCDSYTRPLHTHRMPDNVPRSYALQYRCLNRYGVAFPRRSLQRPEDRISRSQNAYPATMEKGLDRTPDMKVLDRSADAGKSPPGQTSAKVSSKRRSHCTGMSCRFARAHVAYTCRSQPSPAIHPEGRSLRMTCTNAYHACRPHDMVCR